MSESTTPRVAAVLAALPEHARAFVSPEAVAAVLAVLPTLTWPPLAEVQVEAVATVVRDRHDPRELTLDWLVEGGLHEVGADAWLAVLDVPLPPDGALTLWAAAPTPEARTP